MENKFLIMYLQAGKVQGFIESAEVNELKQLKKVILTDIHQEAKRFTLEEASNIIDNSCTKPYVPGSPVWCMISELWVE